MFDSSSPDQPILEIDMAFPEQKSICTSCGHKHALTRHHKIRLADGGTNKPANLVGVCRPCHDRIHGVGRGCEEAYPDMAAAAEACAEHWEVVRESWTWLGYRLVGPVPNIGFDRLMRLEPERLALWNLGSILRQALEESEPRCT